MFHAMFHAIHLHLSLILYGTKNRDVFGIHHSAASLYLSALFLFLLDEEDRCQNQIDLILIDWLIHRRAAATFMNIRQRYIYLALDVTANMSYNKLCMAMK